MNQPILECKNICFSYHNLNGETRALTDISFQVDRGEFVAIVGPSGCGNGMVTLWILWEATAASVDLIGAFQIDMGSLPIPQNLFYDLFQEIPLIYNGQFVKNLPKICQHPCKFLPLIP